MTAEALARMSSTRRLPSCTMSWKARLKRKSPTRHRRLVAPERVGGRPAAPEVALVDHVVVAGALPCG
jgi:hypothetical protein